MPLTRQQAREIDRRAMVEYGIPGIVLMENAGRGVAELFQTLNPLRLPATIVCGPGNNGGDGFVIARHLANHGWPVRVIVPKPPSGGDAWIAYQPILKMNLLYEADSPDREHHQDHGTNVAQPSGWANSAPSLQAGRRWRGDDRNQNPHNAAFNSGWIIDALYGTGLSRPIVDADAVMIEAMNASGLSILAVDIPSGLDSDTGKPLGPCVRASHTATFVAAKQGFANSHAAAFTGDVHIIDIGVPWLLVT